MNREEVKAAFDSMAESYDAQWECLSAINDALHLIMGGVLAGLPTKARLLCVGAGTGSEIIYLAKMYPEWRFTAADPSDRMLDVCRRRLEEHGLEDRCEFHAGYLDTLPSGEPFDAATSLLVSQFILEEESRSGFFQLIADRLKPGGILISSDLSADMNSSDYQSMLQAWLDMMKAGGVAENILDSMRSAYGETVAMASGDATAKLIRSGGFETTNQIFQVGLIRGWCSRKGL